MSASGPSPSAAPATRDCTVSWERSYASITLLANDAEAVVRATAVRQETVALRPGLGAQATRDARRTVFRVTATLRSSAPVPAEVAVLEDVCADLTVSPDEEWVLFLHRADARTEPPTDANYYTLGGPQGQFRVVDGRVAGPFFRFARAVHSYEGATVDEVVADVRAAPTLDPQAGVRFVAPRGWTILRAPPLHDLTLPTNADFVLSVGDVVSASADVGLPLAPYLDRPLIIAPVDLVDTSGRGLEPRAWVALSDGRVVGAWGTAWRGDSACGVFSLRSPTALDAVPCAPSASPP